MSYRGSSSQPRTLCFVRDDYVLTAACNKPLINVWSMQRQVNHLCVHLQVIKGSPNSVRVLGPELIPVSRQSAHRWLVINPAVCCHYFLLGPQLPSQLKSITVLWLVSNYTPWWQRHMCVNNLPTAQGHYMKVEWPEQNSNLRPLYRKSKALTITLPCHTQVISTHQKSKVLREPHTCRPDLYGVIEFDLCFFSC